MTSVMVKRTVLTTQMKNMIFANSLALLGNSSATVLESKLLCFSLYSFTSNPDNDIFIVLGWVPRNSLYEHLLVAISH